jgi:hypothetical protein
MLVWVSETMCMVWDLGSDGCIDRCVSLYVATDQKSHRGVHGFFSLVFVR